MQKIILDTASGSKQQRSGLERARELLRQGDVLVCDDSTGWAGHSNISSN